jgi:hypothetical protein
MTQICGTDAEYRTQDRKAYGTWTAHVRELGYRSMVSDSARPTAAVPEFSPCEVVGGPDRPDLVNRYPFGTPFFLRRPGQ